MSVLRPDVELTKVCTGNAARLTLQVLDGEVFAWTQVTKRFHFFASADALLEDRSNAAGGDLECRRDVFLILVELQQIDLSILIRVHVGAIIV